MRRLRLLRILLPGLLILVAFVLYYSWVPQRAVHSTRAQPSNGEAPHAAKIEYVEWQGGRRTVAGDVDHFEQGENEELHLEGIRDLEIHREDQGPLIVSAGRGDRRGLHGERLWKFADEVDFQETDEDLRLQLPMLEVDEAAGLARSEGDIRFSAPGLSGSGTALVYSLQGGPGHLDDPVIHDDSGGKLTAERADLLDGVRDVEMVGDVRLLREGERLDAGRLHLWRDGNDMLRRVVATEGVWGSWSVGGGPPANVRSERLEVRWDAAGQVESLRLEGDALLRQDVESLSASTIDVRHPEGADRIWAVEARDNVFVQGMFDAGPGLLQTDVLDAQFDEQMAPLSAVARSGVTFEGRDTRAEANEATFTAGIAGGTIVLVAEDGHKARLSHGRTRVAAEKIETDPRGSHLEAEGRVEASVLPGGTSDASDPMRMFAAGEAVHFVSERLESEAGGKRLVFNGSVRAWQGERNLAAQTVVVDQRDNSLEAIDEVTTRFPREENQLSPSEAHYLRVVAGRLTYTEAEGLATYTGDVRVKITEGWLEAQRVEVDLGDEGNQVREVRAMGDVRLEFHRTANEDLPRPVTGGADRVVYDPLSGIVRLFGDEAPASVRREGDGGGTTTGRVLAYSLNQGTLAVDAGERGRAKIRTAGG